MAGTGLTTRIAAFLFALQLVAFAAIYFMRLDGRLMEIPVVQQALEKVRVVRNLDQAWTKFGARQRVWGYVDRHSILPGEKFSLMLSTKPGQPDVEGTVVISRIGANEKRREVWRGDRQPIKAQDLHNTASSLGADWQVNYDIDQTADWKTGYYVVDVEEGPDQRDDNVAAFVVKTPARSGDIMVKISTNTFQAYNRWGGHSLYNSVLFSDKDVMVSFDRPTYAGFFDYETYFVSWIEQYAANNRVTVGYMSDFDLHDDPTLIDGYKLFVSQGHDEYWTKEMFDTIENRIFKQGKNVVFLGANTAYWQVRYADVNQAPGGRSYGRQMICYKEADDPIMARFKNEKDALPYVTEQFRWKNRRPETMLAGVAYQNYFQPGDSGPFFDYQVAKVDLPFFEGTGWKPGDKLRGILGYEWDNRDPEGNGKRLWAEGESMNAQLPVDKLQVLFSGEPIDFEGHKGLAEAVYWESPAGAKVFSSGSIRWDWGFGKPGYTDEAFKTFNKNLFEALSR